MRTKEWLKSKRIEKGISQKELANKIGVSTFAIEKIERGERMGSEDTWTKIESYFDQEKNNFGYILFCGIQQYEFLKEKYQYNVTLNPLRKKVNDLNEVISFLKKENFKCEIQSNNAYCNTFTIYQLNQKFNDNETEEVNCDDLKIIYEFTFNIEQKKEQYDNICKRTNNFGEDYVDFKTYVKILYTSEFETALNYLNKMVTYE